MRNFGFMVRAVEGGSVTGPGPARAREGTPSCTRQGAAHSRNPPPRVSARLTGVHRGRRGRPDRARPRRRRPGRSAQMCRRPTPEPRRGPPRRSGAPSEPGAPAAIRAPPPYSAPATPGTTKTSSEMRSNAPRCAAHAFTREKRWDLSSSVGASAPDVASVGRERLTSAAPHIRRQTRSAERGSCSMSERRRRRHGARTGSATWCQA